MLAIAAVVVVCGLAWADIPALGERVAGAQTGVANRLTIWRETLPIVRDFWLTGTGAGTYQRAMFVYQRSTRAVYFNQAHNHYLQVVAEGGLLLVGTLIVVLAAFVRAARERLTTTTQACSGSEPAPPAAWGSRAAKRLGNRPRHASQRRTSRAARRPRRPRTIA